MKRLLFEIHRWVGIALALFMLLWFFSGLVIIYAEPTTPSRAQQLAHADSLKSEPGWVSAGEAWERSEAQRKEISGKTKEGGSAEKKATNPGVKSEPVEARLLLQAGEPVWLIEDGLGQRFAISALDGALHATTAQQALKIAKSWANRSPLPSYLQSGETVKGLPPDFQATPVQYVDTIDKPAILRNQDALRPFHRIAIADGAGSELLISARTGEIVHASTRIERGFYWAGNWVHLFRPLDLAGLGESRVTVLTWTAFAAVVAALTGLIVGWLRWRPGWLGRKTYSEGRTHPYRHFWIKWHFWGGLIGGTLALTWGLSGFLNNNPWQLFSPANSSKAELARYAGGESSEVTRAWRQVAPQAVDAGADVVELAWRRLGDESVLLAYFRDGRRFPLTVPGTKLRFDEASLIAAVHRIAGDAPVATQTVLQEYDSYYYLRHHRDAADRPLPVLRVELADAAGTHFYIDPQDGRLLAKQDRSRRVFRWVYSALHYWDFGWLYQRPLWDAWMLIWVLLGLVLSFSAVIIAWKRLAITFRRKRHDISDGTASENLIPAAAPERLASANQPG